MDKLQIEPGGLAQLDADRVVEVLAYLRDNAIQCERHASAHGENAAYAKRKGWHAAAEHGATIAARYGWISLAYRDAMLWIMSATATAEFSLAVPDEPPRAS